MADMTMRERVARAIDPVLWYNLDRPDDAAVIGHPSVRRAHSLAKAEVAIAAMRDITGPMIEATHDETRTDDDLLFVLAQRTQDLAKSEVLNTDYAKRVQAFEAIRDAVKARMTSPSHDRATTDQDLAVFGASEASGYYAPGPADGPLRRAFEDGAAFAITGKLPPTDGADRAMAEGGWQDIESAPKDGSEILLSDHGDAYAGFWSAVENYRSWAEPDGNWYAEMDRGNEATAKPQRPEYWRSMRDLAPPTPTTKKEKA